MHGCNGCDPYGAVNEDCPIHGNPAHEETRSRLAEVTAERDALVEGVADLVKTFNIRKASHMVVEPDGWGSEDCWKAETVAAHRVPASVHDLLARTEEVSK